MKKYLYLLLLAIFVFTSCENDSEVIDLNSAEKQLHKVDICHYDEYTGTWETISISENAVKTHLKHGDFLGSCDRKTYVPDDWFESYLISEGYDEYPLDDYVLTKNIISVKKLIMENVHDGNEFYWPLRDLTGIEDFLSLEVLILGHWDGSNTQWHQTLEVGLDLTKNINLSELYIGGVYIPYIDLSNSINLQKLTLEYDITTDQDIDLSNCLKLVELRSSLIWNLRDVDLSNHQYLKLIYLNNGGSGIWNLKNGRNKEMYVAISGARFSNSPSCVEVDDPEWSYENWILDETGAVFRLDCGY